MTADIDPALDRLARNVGEVVDHFLTAPYCVSGGPSAFAERPIIFRLHAAARKLTGDMPLTYAAARALMQRVPQGGRLVIGTGFVVPPFMRLEGDGPIGTASLARAMTVVREAHPIVVTEPVNVPAVETMMRASGLQLAPLEEALDVPHKTAVLPFPVMGEAESQAHARELLDRLKPDAIVTIEKPSRTGDGKYRNGMAVDVSAVSAKLDAMIDEAGKRGILTIGLGDGGNEIGMGNILPTIEEHVPNGKLVGAVTGAEILVVAATAGWGGYGIEACLAALSGKAHALHDEAMERRLLDASAMAGIVDPMTGLAEGFLDGVPSEVNYAILRILRFILEVRTNPYAVQNYRSWTTRKDECVDYLARYAPKLA